jgi:hypothetical protein
MFIELMPLIERRTITITVAALKQGRIRLNVVPTALAEDSEDQLLKQGENSPDSRRICRANGSEAVPESSNLA